MLSWCFTYINFATRSSFEDCLIEFHGELVTGQEENLFPSRNCGPVATPISLAGKDLLFESLLKQECPQNPSGCFVSSSIAASQVSHAQVNQQGSVD